MNPATSGHISIDSQDVSSLPPERRNVNTVFQSYALFPHMNVFENVAFGLRMKKRPKAEISREVGEALRLVQLEGFETRMVVGFPEASSSEWPLPGPSSIVLWSCFWMNRSQPWITVCASRCSSISSTFSASSVLPLSWSPMIRKKPFSMSDRVVVMNNGHIEQIGTPVGIYEEPRNLYVARFVGEINILEAEVVEQAGDRARVQARWSRCMS